MLHVGCGLTGGEREKKKKKRKSNEKENGIDYIELCTLNHAYQPVFFFHLYCKNFNKRLFFFFFINKMYHDKTRCFRLGSTLFQLLSRPCNCYHPGII